MDLLFGFVKLGGVFALVDPLSGHAYLGPETVMPLASILAGIVGFLLVFWRFIVKNIKKAIRKMRGLPEEVPPDVDVDEMLTDEPLAAEEVTKDES